MKKRFFFGVRLIANSISANPCSPSMAAFMNRLPQQCRSTGGGWSSQGEQGGSSQGERDLMIVARRARWRPSQGENDFLSAHGQQHRHLRLGNARLISHGLRRWWTGSPEQPVHGGVAIRVRDILPHPVYRRSRPVGSPDCRGNII